MQDKISLTPQAILEKDFKIDTRGYRLKEVDQFLDEIIGDYEQFYAIINNLEKEKEDYLKEIMNLKQELRNIKMSIDIAKTGNKEVTNMDILRRISNLEKIVYGKDENLEKEE
jgi:DivIVA domain-containing protein